MSPILLYKPVLSAGHQKLPLQNDKEFSIDSSDLETVTAFLHEYLSANPDMELFTTPHQHGRKLEAPVRECNELVDRYTRDEALEIINDRIMNIEGLDDGTKLFVGMVLGSIVQYGVESWKICASCADLDYVEDESFQEYCGSDAYGSDATVSGILFLPLDGDSIATGPKKGSIWNHPSESDSFYVASEGWGSGSKEATQNAAFLVASSGVINLVPDYLGYGESYTFYKSYLIKKAYQTSVVPLYLYAQQVLIPQITNCQTQLSNSVVVNGYSEGGYATVAVSYALSMLGFDILMANAGAGPYKLSDIQWMASVENIDSGLYPPRNYFSIALWGSAYSSTNPDLPNYDQGQNFANDEYLKENDFSRNMVQWTLAGLTRKEINDLIPTDDPLITVNQDLLAMAREAIIQGITDPCITLDSQGINDKICSALEINDLTEIILDVRFPYKFCHSPDDEIVSYFNIPFDHIPADKIKTVDGNHDSAGVQCFLDALMFYLTTDFANAQMRMPESIAFSCDNN